VDQPLVLINTPVSTLSKIWGFIFSSP